MVSGDFFEGAGIEFLEQVARKREIPYIDPRLISIKVVLWQKCVIFVGKNPSAATTSATLII
jgi:hypothetical protein